MVQQLIERTAPAAGSGAIPANMRDMIEDFNRLSKDAQTVALARMRKNMQQNPAAVEKFVQQIGQAREQGRDQGMSR